MSPLKRLPSLIVKRSLRILSRSSTGWYLPNFGTVVGETPTPYGILALWAVNGLSIVYWVNELLKNSSYYLIGDSDNNINNIRMSPLKCFPPPDCQTTFDYIEQILHCTGYLTEEIVHYYLFIIYYDNIHTIISTI